MAGPIDEGNSELLKTEEEPGDLGQEEEVNYQATQKDKEVHQFLETPKCGTK